MGNFEFIEVLGSTSYTSNMDDACKKKVRVQAMKHFLGQQVKRRPRGVNRKHSAFQRAALLRTRPTGSTSLHSSSCRHQSGFTEEASTNNSGHISSDDEVEREIDYALVTRETKTRRPPAFTVTLLAAPHNAQINREGLISAYIDDVVPSAWQHNPSVLETWQLWRGTTLSMQSVDDAIGLLHVGCSNSDNNVIMQARKTHVAAIRHLRYELNSTSFDLESVLTAALSLLFCEIYKPVALGAQSLDGHMIGVTTIIKTIHQRAKAGSSPLLRSLQVNFRQNCLFHALVTKNKLPLPSYCWHAGLKQPVLGSAEALIRLGVRLPELLENARWLCRQTSAGPVLGVAIYEKLRKLEEDLTIWRKDFQNSDIASAVPPEEMTNQIQTDDNPTLFKFGPLVFKSFYEGEILQMYWCFLLILRQTAVDLESFNPELRSKSFTSWAEADECADLLCQSIPDISKKAGAAVMTKVLAMCAPLRFAGEWYEYSFNDKALAWCGDVENRLRQEVWFLNWENLLPFSFITATWIFGLD